MLTKADCVKCKQAKMVLEKVLDNKYKDDITMIQKETEPAKYNELVNKHNIMTLPSFISQDKVLVDVSISSLTQFLKSATLK